MAKWIDRCVLIHRLESPQRYGRPLKWFITGILAAASLIDPIGYTILYPALPQIPSALSTSDNVANLASTLCFIGPALMPLYWGSLSEKYGRRIVYLISVSLFTLFAGIAGGANSITTFIVTRVLGSFCGCAVTTVGGAVVADLWESEDRGFAMSIYYLGIYAGPALGPVLGGVLVNAWDWRSVQWFLAAYGGTMLLLLAFFLPETLTPAEQRDNESAEKASEDTMNGTVSSKRQNPVAGILSIPRRIIAEIVDPMRALHYFRYPIIALVIYLASISFGVIIITATSIQNAYHSAPYNFSYLTIGLLYIPMPVGLVPGGLLAGKWSDHIMVRAAKAEAASSSGEGGKVVYKPENRLRENGWIAVAVIPIALIWYGWAIQEGLFWPASIMPWLVLGFGTGMVFSLVTTMVTEFVPTRSATMVALNSLGRNAFAAAGGSVTQPLVNTIGNGWLYTGLTVISLGNFVAVGLLRSRGKRWREQLDAKEGFVRGGVVEEDHRLHPVASVTVVMEDGTVMAGGNWGPRMVDGGGDSDRTAGLQREKTRPNRLKKQPSQKQARR